MASWRTGGPKPEVRRFAVVVTIPGEPHWSDLGVCAVGEVREGCYRVPLSREQAEDVPCRHAGTQYSSDHGNADRGPMWQTKGSSPDEGTKEEPRGSSQQGYIEEVEIRDEVVLERRRAGESLMGQGHSKEGVRRTVPRVVAGGSRPLDRESCLHGERDPGGKKRDGQSGRKVPLGGPVRCPRWFVWPAVIHGCVALRNGVELWGNALARDAPGARSGQAQAGVAMRQVTLCSPRARTASSTMILQATPGSPES